MLRKKMFRDIKANKSQFIAIFLMVFLGVFAYCGIRSYMAGMQQSADKFYEECNLQDLNVRGENFSYEDLEKIKSIDNVKNAERKLTIVASIEGKEDKTLQLNFIESNEISKFYVFKGEKFAKSKSGLWIDNYYAENNNIKVGDTIKLKYDGIELSEEVLGLINVPDHVYDMKDESAIFPEHKDYGYRRIKGELGNRGFRVNKKKVQRIVQKLGLQVTSFMHKSRKYSSYKGKVGKVAPNRINRRFHTNIPHQKITTDTTEFKYYQVDEKGRMIIKKLYLDPFMDMCNSEIISFGISQRPSPYRRTFHSDQGWAYQMKAYVHSLKENKIFQSMSRKGNCHDNSVMENFFGIMKQEMYYGKVYYSYDELKNAIEKYIKYYNEKRIKQKLGWLSPVNYRINLAAA